jgi:hypothetical protein
MIDFVICGFARSGTTHLATWMNRHKEIELFDPNLPELKFFSRTNIFNRGRNWYINNFKCKGKIIGEKSAEYSESIDFPYRAFKLFPRLKLIYIIRNPVERAISNYYWSIKNGFERRSLNAALADELKEGIEINGMVRINQTRPYCYLGRSIYSRSLSLVYNFFPSEQIILIDFDNYIKSKSETLQNIGEFLGFLPQASLHSAISYSNRKTQALKESINKRFVDILMDDFAKVKEKFILV